MKNDLTARVRYSKKDDAFIIEILQEDGTWRLNSLYKCRKVEGGEDTDHLHFSIVNNILQMIAMGYHVYKSDAED